MISKHLVPDTKEFCAVLNLSHPIGRFECCVPNTSHRLRHCLASLLGHGPARAQFMKHEETIDFVEFKSAPHKSPRTLRSPKVVDSPLGVVAQS